MGPGEKKESLDDILENNLDNDEEYIDMLVDSIMIENEINTEDEKTEEDLILESFGY